MYPALMTSQRMLPFRSGRHVRFARHLGMIDTRLAAHPHFAGDTFTAADILLHFPFATMQNYVKVDLAERPAAVQRLMDQARAADALVLACPEYNYSIAPALKNALDWLSRTPEGGQTEARSLGALRRAITAESTMVLVTHKPALIALVDRLVILVGGRILMDGPRDMVLAHLRKMAIEQSDEKTKAGPPTPTRAVVPGGAK